MKIPHSTAQALETLMWQHNADDETALIGPSDDAIQACTTLVDALYEIVPDGMGVSDKMIHRAVLDVMGHGTGLWDDHYEEWEGRGKALSDALRARIRWECTYVGDDGLLYLA